jgi:hypothetical protein
MSPSKALQHALCARLGLYVSRNPFPEQANEVPNSKQKPMWKPESVGEVIAEREFALASPSGRNTRIWIRFGKPVRGKGTSRRDPWWCPVGVRGEGLRMEWLGDTERLVLARHAAHAGVGRAVALTHD